MGQSLIKVILCDDHALIRRGIRDTLCDAPDIEVVGEAGDYGELRVLMRDTTADVLVLDINLPGRSGLDVLHVLKDEHTTMRVLVDSRRRIRGRPRRRRGSGRRERGCRHQRRCSLCGAARGRGLRRRARGRSRRGALPFGTLIRVTNTRNNRSVDVTVTDRGPHTKGYIVDVSRRAAVQLDIIEAGVVPVVVTVIRAAPGR